MAKRVMTQAAQALLEQVLNLPPQERIALIEELKDLVPDAGNSAAKAHVVGMRAGCLPGFKMAPDFDEPLNDFDGYRS